MGHSSEEYAEAYWELKDALEVHGPSEYATKSDHIIAATAKALLAHMEASRGVPDRQDEPTIEADGS